MSKSNTKLETLKAEETAAASDGVVIPSSVEEAEGHVRAFISAFVLPQVQPRWVEFLIDRRSEWDAIPCSPRSIKIRGKARDMLRIFAADERYCVRVPNAKRTAAYYETTFGNAPGVYFALGTAPCKLTAAEADVKFSYDDESALLSFQAGKKVLFFCHDGGVWKCEKE
jgi:hypothetical protein